MKDFACFNYTFLFNDHFQKISKEAKLLYVELMFYADRGFVSNPVMILHSRGYETDALNELIANDELLTLKGRDEMFITSYYVHNRGFGVKEWLSSPFATYWKGKLWIKENRIATLNISREEYERNNGRNLKEFK